MDIKDLAGAVHISVVAVSRETTPESLRRDYPGILEEEIQEAMQFKARMMEVENLAAPQRRRHQCHHPAHEHPADRGHISAHGWD